MKNYFTITCMAFMMMFHLSCQDNEMEWISTNKESRALAAEQKVQNLVQQARQGKTEAYKSLAYCYRDGKGVEKSYMNAIFMYLVYCQKTGQELETSIELFEEGNPYRLLFEIAFSDNFDEETETKITLLHQLAPADTKAIVSMADFCLNGKDNNTLGTLQEAESEGSELARALQILYHEETKDTTMYQQSLVCVAEKHPFLYPKLAPIYEEKYFQSGDFSNLQKAMEFYYKADYFGMLSPRQANNLWSMYDYFSKKGVLEYDEQEVERLKKIMKTEKRK